jgi:diaminopimelate decarboxylase
MELIPFLSAEQVRLIQDEIGTPVYVYDQATLEEQADHVLDFPNAYGLIARYAMKASPSAAVLRVLTNRGLHIDASSGHEAVRAMKAGVSADRIQITTQQIPGNLGELIDQGCRFNACSLNQVEAIGSARPGTEIALRINPGLGSGHSNRTNVGGPAASFGIWHEYLPDALNIAKKHNLTVKRMHTHIGSGSDPEVWERVALMSLDLCSRIPGADSLSLGGGYKVGRVKGEVSTDLQKIGLNIVEAFRAHAGKHGVELELEVEPGTYLVANACALVSTAIDVVDTGKEGYRFIKVDTGMTELLRPSLYGAQHPIETVPLEDGERPHQEYIVAGHCCESGDVLTPAPDDSEGLQPRFLIETRPGDAVVVGGAGAYCSGMAAKNYNSFPEAAEVMIMRDGSIELMRRRQTLDQVLQNEVVPVSLR